MADIEYLKSLQAVRERAHLVLQAAERDALTHFDYVPANMAATADFVAGIITVCLGRDHLGISAWLMGWTARFRPRQVRQNPSSWPLAAL